MRNRTEYLEFLSEWLAPFGEITMRAMMGGHVMYCDGVVFALVADNTLHLKVDDQTRSRFEALGLEPFRPFPDRPEVMQYYPPPADFFEDTDAMKDWGRDAIETGRRAQSKKKPAKRPQRTQKRR
jgi:DNA transformation protein